MPPRDRDHGFQQNACPANVAETWGGNSGSYAPEQAEEEEEEEDEEERERERERGQNPTKKSAKRATTRAQPIGSTSRRDSPEVDSGAGTRPLGAKHSPEKTAVMRVVAPLGTSQNEQLRIPTRGHWHAAAAPWTGQRRPWRAPWPACNGHRGQFVPRSPAAARLPQLTTERGRRRGRQRRRRRRGGGEEEASPLRGRAQQGTRRLWWPRRARATSSAPRRPEERPESPSPSRKPGRSLLQRFATVLWRPMPTSCLRAVALP
ncbi:unnamed protein product [Prorocentrum cordatum]|uniref:Uncharacterized protein n=1 Tax=Prorocentrum cordatum TaxID=2364126 RepID=A0ABN9Q7F6_9DINO|nr:unnamed protein product [Polarella glacialis]